MLFCYVSYLASPAQVAAMVKNFSSGHVRILLDSRVRHKCSHIHRNIHGSCFLEQACPRLSKKLPSSLIMPASRLLHAKRVVVQFLLTLAAVYSIVWLGARERNQSLRLPALRIKNYARPLL